MRPRTLAALNPSPKTLILILTLTLTLTMRSQPKQLVGFVPYRHMVQIN